MGIIYHCSEKLTHARMLAQNKKGTFHNLVQSKDKHHIVYLNENKKVYF